jgi:hypothetical protein
MLGQGSQKPYSSDQAPISDTPSATLPQRRLSIDERCDLPDCFLRG